MSPSLGAERPRTAPVVWQKMGGFLLAFPKVDVPQILQFCIIL